MNGMSLSKGILTIKYPGHSFLFLGKIVPHGFTNRYWAGMGKNIQGLLIGDDSKFWSFYRNIIRETIHYTGLQLLGVFLSILPLIILMMTIWPWLQSNWNQNATVTITPNDVKLHLLVSKQ